MLLFPFLNNTDGIDYRKTIPIITPDAKPAQNRIKIKGKGWQNQPVSRTPQQQQTIILPIRVKTVYSIVRATTGSIGGNADGGAIYGETTAFSLQKIIELMKVHTNFTAESRFIDIGSGLGKPNLHVAQDPGVKFSFGIEIKRLRWMLSLHNLRNVLQYRIQQMESDGVNEANLLGYHCFFSNADIYDATTLDPFTHVYMYDIGFPPKLMEYLSDIFNRSCSAYLICYHPPSLMIDRYYFDIVLICQQNTAMHGSGENHQGYIYKRATVTNNSSPDIPCDPIFADAWNIVKSGLTTIRDIVCEKFSTEINSPRPKRHK